MSLENPPMLPDRKERALYTVAIDPLMKKRLHYLKEQKRVNVPELVRQKIQEILRAFDL